MNRSPSPISGHFPQAMQASMIGASGSVCSDVKGAVCSRAIAAHMAAVSRLQVRQLPGVSEAADRINRQRRSTVDGRQITLAMRPLPNAPRRRTRYERPKASPFKRIPARHGCASIHHAPSLKLRAVPHGRAMEPAGQPLPLPLSGGLTLCPVVA